MINNQLRMITKRTRTLLSSMIVLLVIGFQSGYAANIILEAEDFKHGYNTQNIEIREQGSSPYSGGKYTIVTGHDGEPALHFTVSETGEYTIKFFYCGGSNNWYNLYHTAVDNSNKLRNGQMNYSESLTSHEFNLTLNAGTDYYVGVYGETGTIYDYAQIIKDGTVVATLEAEDFETGYNTANVSIVGEEPVTYSGGKYTFVKEHDGEAALPFSVPTAGTYTIKVHYHGGTNTYFNLYHDQVDNSYKMSDYCGRITDLAQLGSYQVDAPLEAGKTYYVGVYGDTETIFDYAEIISPYADPSSITLTAPAHAYRDEIVSLSASTENVTNPVITYSVKAPGASTFSTITLPYTVTTTGNHTFKAEVAEYGDATILASDEKEVMVYAKIVGGTKFYLTPNDWWKSDNARYAMYCFYDEYNYAWADFVEVDENVYEAVTPGGTWTNIIFLRMDPSAGNSWNNTWNQTSDLQYDGVNNHYTIHEGSWSEGTWSVYSIPLKTFTVTVPQGTENVYIAGNFPDKHWDISNPYQLTSTENPRVFTGTFQCSSLIQYKYFNGTNDWDFGEATDNLTIGGDGNPSGRSDRSYNISDEVKYWVASPKFKIEVSFPNGVAVPSNLHVKGNWNEWGTATDLTYADGKFSGTINQKVYANTTYKYRTDDVAIANWEIRKLPNTENTNNPSNDRWAIYPSMSDKIIGFVTDNMVHVGRKPANNLKIEEDLNITIPAGATVNYLLTTGSFSEANPTNVYDATNGIAIGTSGVYYLKRKISQNDSSYIKQTPINIGPITWKDNGNTAWATATNWTINSTVVNRAPITKEDVVIPSSLSNYPVLNTDVNIGSLEIASGAKITINTESKLAVDGNITNANGTSGILIKADPDKATGTLLFNNPVNEPVQATVEMYARGSWDVIDGKIKNTKWQYFGIPFTEINNIEQPFYGAVIRQYNQAGTTSSSMLPVTTGKWIQLINGSSLAPIQGYEIAQLAPKTYVMSGTLYKGDFNYDVVYTSTTVSNPGQHIIANPYMAAIPIDLVNFGGNSRMDETVYIYNTGSSQQFNANESKTGTNPGQYLASPLNIGGYAGIPNEIAPMQGFLVRTGQGITEAGSFSISYNQLVKNTAKQRAPKPPKSWLRLTLSSENSGDAMWLFAHPETGRDFDNGWDGRKMGGDAGTPMLFSHNETGNYQINAMNDIDETDIAFRAGSADTDYTITFNHGDGIMDKYIAVYFEDKETGNIVDITEDGTTYTFNSNNQSITSRFKIHASKVISDVADEDLMPVYVYADGRNLIINNASKEMSRIDLYDTLGRLHLSYHIQAGEMNTYQPDVPQGTYIVKVTHSTVQTYKVVLN